MSPEHAAAHLIAKHLRAIALLLPRLSPDGYGAFRSGIEDDCIHEERAKRLEATAPFDPVTDEQRGAIFESYVDCMGDLSGRERAEVVVDGWTEAEWRMEQDDQEEMDRDEAEVDEGDDQ